MNKKEFAKNIKLLKDIYGFSCSEDYLKALESILTAKGISDKELTQCVDHIVLNVDNEEWNKIFGFNGKPSPAYFIKMIEGSGSLHSEQEQAEIEANKILVAINSVKYGGGVIMDNGFSNQTIYEMDGIANLRWLLDEDNPNRRESHWLKKDLKEMWLTCKDLNKQKFTPSFTSGSNKTINKIGNEEICLQFISQYEKPQIEDKSESQIDGIILKLSSTLKKNDKSYIEKQKELKNRKYQHLSNKKYKKQTLSPEEIKFMQDYELSIKQILKTA